ncbi:unnamed protein product [Symbiodinium necroappetens]|uniref:Uncharacterized protein n=1 Tax=Symbiodinium necroappetens TaxID=1628268 RepID=A0A812T757_9DINO|nr:unnamed protein product [Symbiodinium necroappetens]
MPSNGEGSSQVVLNSPVVEISILLEAQGKVSVATVSDLAEPILVRLSDASQQPRDVCAFFDHTSRAWSSVGLQAISVNDLRWCQSTHLSMLAIVHVVPFEGLIAEQDTSFELTSIALACASLFAGGGVLFLLWYYRCKPARGGSVQIQGKGDQTFVVTYSRSTRSADHEPDEPMKSISTKSLSFQAFRSEASASAASKVHIEWNIQANDWKTRLHDLEGWTGDLKQHHATQAAEVGRGRPGPASTDAPKDAPDLLATLKRAETAAMEEAERLEFLVEVDAPVPVDSLQVAEDPQKAARPSFYRNGEAVLYFSITNQCWLLARIQGDPAWMNSEEQIDRDVLPTGELPHYDCILPGPKQLRHRVPLSQLRQRLRCGESVHVHVEEVTRGRRSRASRTWSWKSGHIHKIPPVAMTTVDPYAVTLSSGDTINVDLGRIRRFYETGSRVRVFRGLHGWHYGTVFEDAVEAATTTSDSSLAKSMESDNADIQVRLDGTDDVVKLVWLVAILAQLVEANYWEQLSPSGAAPPARYRIVDGGVWSPAANGFYVFGGEGAGSSNLNDLWFYGREVNSWEQLSPSGTAPPAREHHTVVWSPAANGFYVFGGDDGPGPESASEAVAMRCAGGIAEAAALSASSTTCGSTGVRPMRAIVELARFEG